jgi:hypothetical protein
MGGLARDARPLTAAEVAALDDATLADALSDQLFAAAALSATVTEGGGDLGAICARAACAYRSVAALYDGLAARAREASLRRAGARLGRALVRAWEADPALLAASPVLALAALAGRWGVAAALVLASADYTTGVRAVARAVADEADLLARCGPEDERDDDDDA